MTSSCLIAAVCCTLLGCVPSSARDAQTDALKKIARKIGKEPTYKKSPKYCLIVFGTEAKFRVWLVIDGDVLHVDLNGNGDLTDRGERFKLEMTDRDDFSSPCEVGDISDPNTKLKHKGFTVGLYGNGVCRLSVEASFENPKIPRLFGFAHLTFASKPADAPVVHFGGPLKMGLSTATVDDRPAFICAKIGTPGVGKGTFVDYSKSVFSHIDAKLQPDVELETPGEKNAIIREKAKFYRDSIERVYLYPVRPGEKGDKRRTKITLSFSDWTDGKVVPGSFSEPIVTLEK